ncbi:MAG TPA: hypothetical protein VNH14_15545 [Gemmatimonadales bacterium]|nr:hypothetical protein [Gemmatimonadales bacterium]
MSHLELHAHLKIRPGQLEGFKAQAAEIMRITLEQDTKTLRYDWYIKEEGTECEVHETYVNEAGLFEHNRHVVEARTVLFRDYAFRPPDDRLRRRLPAAQGPDDQARWGDNCVLPLPRT